MDDAFFLVQHHIEDEGQAGGFSSVDYFLVAMGKLCAQSGAMEVFVAEDSNTKERIWSVRRNIAEAFKVFSPIQSLEDIVVPTSRIPGFILKFERLSSE